MILCVQLLDCATEALLIKQRLLVRWKKMCGLLSQLARWSRWFTRRFHYLKLLRLIGWWKLAPTSARYCCFHDCACTICALSSRGVSSRTYATSVIVCMNGVLVQHCLFILHTRLDLFPLNNALVNWILQLLMTFLCELWYNKSGRRSDGYVHAITVF